MKYSRQEKFKAIGSQGQAALATARVMVCGCGALGSMIAERLTRAGVGHIRIVDRDWVEESNLSRQALFTAADAEHSTPKAVAAVGHLREINPDIELESHVEDVTCDNIAALAESCQLILDGTDNFETRFLLNDYALQSQTMWVHGAILGASGQVMSVVPGVTPCFRCLLPDLPPAEVVENCDSVGVIGPAVGVVANLQATEALKLIVGDLGAVHHGPFLVDCWRGEFRKMTLSQAVDCPACEQRKFAFLTGQVRSEANVLCGKNAVQLKAASRVDIGDSGLRARLSGLGELHVHRFFLRVQFDEFRVSIFRGGRSIVEGTTSIAEAKTVLARLLGV